MEGCSGRQTGRLPVHHQASERLRVDPSDKYEKPAPARQNTTLITSLSPFSPFIP